MHQGPVHDGTRWPWPVKRHRDRDDLGCVHATGGLPFFPRTLLSRSLRIATTNATPFWVSSALTMCAPKNPSGRYTYHGTASFTAMKPAAAMNTRPNAVRASLATRRGRGIAASVRVTSSVCFMCGAPGSAPEDHLTCPSRSARRCGRRPGSSARQGSNLLAWPTPRHALSPPTCPRRSAESPGSDDAWRPSRPPRRPPCSPARSRRHWAPISGSAYPGCRCRTTHRRGLMRPHREARAARSVRSSRQDPQARRQSSAEGGEHDVPDVPRFPLVGCPPGLLDIPDLFAEGREKRDCGDWPPPLEAGQAQAPEQDPHRTVQHHTAYGMRERMILSPPRRAAEPPCR